MTPSPIDNAKQEAHDEEVKYDELHHHWRRIRDCLVQIQLKKRPFRHDYQGVSHHNGDYYDTYDIVWLTEMPADKDIPKDETYTPVDPPEYTDALKLIRKFTPKTAKKKSK